MSTQEFYIREALETEARGPFNLEQLVSLAETGQVTTDTLWYDSSVEDWATIGSTDELKSALFPEKRKLRMKAREPMQAVRSADALPAITIADMLAGAEGRTAETRDKIDPSIAQGTAAKIGMWAAVLALVLAAAGEALPSADAIGSLDYTKLLAQPIVFLGIVDLFLALVLGLGVVSTYPFIRFRSALGIGFFGLIFFTQAQGTGTMLPLVPLVIGCAGLYLLTITIEMMPVVIVSVLAVAGNAGTAYFLLSA